MVRPKNPEKDLSRPLSPLGFFAKVLDKPLGALLILPFIVCVLLIADGSWIRYLRLAEAKDSLQAQVVDLKQELGDLEQQIQLVKDPKYLEQQAVDRFDYAEEHDLVFVFSD